MWGGYALVEFARELSSETDLQKMLESVTDRLMRTLSIRQVAVFLRDEDSGDLWSPTIAPISLAVYSRVGSVIFELR